MAGIFSQETIERVRGASDIVDVIGSYLPLKRAGANFVALCPFHKEKSPSFNVNPHRQIFHCFGCHKGGDVFTFVKEYENVEFPDAVQRLAERAKIPVEYERGAPDAQVRHIKDQLLQVHEQIAQRWQTALANDAAGQIARDYLAKRGVSEEAIKLFRIGYAPDLWDDTVNWAKSKNHDLALIEKAGLVVRKEGADHFYDRFRGRLMFPICDEQGRVIAFSGRILSGDEKTAKYVNSPETPIFTKSKVFFGLDKSKRAVLDAGYAVVCEGQLDLIACFMAGVQNIVAPQGTAFTADHARIIKRYVDEVVLCFDSDEAGQSAAVRSLDALLASGLAVRVAVVPAPHDPDSFIKQQGADAFRKLVERADGYFDYLLNRLCAANDVATDKGRLTVLREMAEAVRKTGNVVTIDKYAQKTALRLGVTPDAVRAEFKKSPNARTSQTLDEEDFSTEPDEATRFAMPSTQEVQLLKILLETDDFVSWFSSHFDINWLRSSKTRELVKLRCELFQAGEWRGLPDFLLRFPAFQELTTEILTRPLVLSSDGTKYRKRKQIIPDPGQSLVGIAEQMRNQYVDSQLASLNLQLSQPETADAEKVVLLRQQQELRLLKRQPLSSQ